MAAGLNEAITVEQTLHGYRDGHRRLAGSFQASPTTTRAMLVLSDLSSSTARVASGGYLTGYPLRADGLYVLARTWGAPEMPRPGCVWTHSLVLDFADLASLSAADALLELFRRPGGDLASYERKLSIPKDRPAKPAARSDALEAVVRALYGEPLRKVVAPIRDPLVDEADSLAIWMQQWPRLRRTFRFCCNSGTDRSTASEPFDLQFVQSVDRPGLARFPDAVPSVLVGEVPGLQTLVSDLREPDAEGLRAFLRTVGADVEGGRAAAAPLCRLHALLSAPNAAGLEGATVLLAELEPSRIRFARDQLVSKALGHAGDLAPAVVDFVMVETLGGAAARDVDERLPRFAWTRARGRFVEALASTGASAAAARHALSQLGTDELVCGLADVAGMVPTLVVERPELLEHPGLWRLPNSDAGLLPEVTSAEAWPRIVRALVVADRRDLSGRVSSRLGVGKMLQALGWADDVDPAALARWFETLSWDRWQIAKSLAAGDIAARASLAALASTLDPDDIPNDYGDDPWWTAYSNTLGPADEQWEDLLAAFLMARALGWRSRSPAHLMRATFDRLYAALASGRLHSRGRRLLDRRLSWSTRRERDGSVRLVDAVVNRFVDDWLDPETFGRLVDDGPLWKSLADYASKTGRGRRYLGAVADSVVAAAEPGIRRRADYLRKLGR